MKHRIIIGDSFNPYHNLAVENLLLESVEPRRVTLYLWQNENTVVIGRHQNPWRECRVKLLQEEGGRLARRSTGGGAVYHDLGNLNFSFVLPRSLCDVPRQLGVIRRAVAAFGIDTAFTGRNDLIVTGAGGKFSGNAFKYTAAAGLHHGTLLVNEDMARLSRYLAPGTDKLRARGIESVRARVCNLRALNPHIDISALAGALQRAFTEEYGPAEVLSASALDSARLQALEALYASWDFRMGKALPFDATLETRFPWGGVTLELRLERGAVAAAQVFSDAMDDAMIDRIAPALAGQRYRNDDLAAALRALNVPMIDDIAAWLAGVDLG